MMNEALKAIYELSKTSEFIAIQDLSIAINLSIKETQVIIDKLEKKGQVKVLHRSSNCPIVFELL